MAKQPVVHSTQGVELVRKLAEEGRFIFTSQEARVLGLSMGISETYIRQVLHYLERTNWIIRLKNGLYSLSSSMPGISPLHEFQIAMRLVNPAAISHWSALHYHGMTEQIPRQIFVLTTARSLPRARGLKAIHNQKGYLVKNTVYHFIQMKSDHFFGIEEIWINDSKVNMTDPERTLLDCLMFPEYCGGFFEVLHLFERYLSKLEIKKIVQYAVKLDSATVKRLGWILEYYGISLSELELLLNAPIKGYRLLDKTGSREGKYNSRWKIQENLSSHKI